MSIRSFAATLVGKSSYWFLHTFLKGGSSLPGQLAQKIDPDVLRHLAKDYDLVIVTGTNGKTLTTALIVKILQQKFPVLTNPTGSNMLQGIITAFLATSKSRSARPLAVLEVDEANVAPVCAAVTPKAFVLTNLFRDQMDRYGEIYSTYQKILDGIKLAPEATVIMNGDAPIFSARDIPNPKIYYGFANSQTQDLLAPPNTDSVLCPVCQHILHYHLITYANLGDFYCPNCGFKRPALTNSVTKLLEQSPTHSKFELDGQIIELNIGGLYNIYNALAADSVGRFFGITPAEIAHGLNNSATVFGRQEVIKLADKQVTLILVKNPVGLNQVLEMITTAKEPFSLAFLLNANYADGIDTSWIWDGNFEELVASHQAVAYLAGGERMPDSRFRLQVAGVADENLSATQGMEQVLNEIHKLPSKNVYVLATYTAVLQLRKKLAEQGFVKKELD